MKICFVAPANNYHTKKWATWFSKRGHEVHVVSFIRDDIPGTKVHFIDTGVNAEDSDSSKIKYLLHARELKKTVDRINPDIVNVHYATSYGTVAALSGIKKYILSVWGSDIYDFPKRSVLHKIMLEFSLYRATWLFSTSKAMAEEARKYTRKIFKITPFGVDMNLFNPDKRTRSNDDNLFVIGTVKSLSKVYGIEFILKAAALIKKRNPEIPLRVRIAGKGDEEQYYKDLAKKLGINDIVDWLGFISQEQAAVEWANMDVAVIPSLSESFGVSAVEAQACGTTVVISDIPGLMETTKPKETSVVVKRESVIALSNGIITLYNDSTKRNQMALRGRTFVEEKYPLDKCFIMIENVFKKLVGNK
jgi:glycosyltransferase involved in cell wall biosynthesis